MGDRESQIKKIHAISRIENLSLWQSYAAKKNSLMMRAKNEGVPDATAQDYEVSGMYHGCSLDVIPKIAQQVGRGGRSPVEAPCFDLTRALRLLVTIYRASIACSAERTPSDMARACTLR